MINLVDLLSACGTQINLASYKVHLATVPSDGDSPLQAFFDGRFKSWQEHQTKRNFECDMVISLIEMRRHKWLFAGVYRLLGYKKIKDKHFQYSTELIDGQEKLIGRIIVNHKRIGRQSYLLGKKDGGDFFVSEVKDKRLTIEEFPGYNSAVIPFQKLRTIIRQSESTWLGALSNVKGVYLITDTKSGDHYVGSAIGGSGIWQRWCDYIKTGHGGNKLLVNLLKDKGIEYTSNFQYSVLEIADSNASDDYIRGRESHWKKALRSKDFGLNAN